MTAPAMKEEGRPMTEVTRAPLRLQSAARPTSSDAEKDTLTAPDKATAAPCDHLEFDVTRTYRRDGKEIIEAKCRNAGCGQIIEVVLP